MVDKTNNRLSMLLVVAFVFIVVVIGSFVVFTQIDAVESFYDEHGYYPELGGPPFVTNLFPMVFVMIISFFLVFVVLMFNRKVDEI